jgi:hypothetical protein
MKTQCRTVTLGLIALSLLRTHVRSQGNPAHGALVARASHGERYTSKVCRQKLESSREGVKRVKPQSQWH